MAGPLDSLLTDRAIAHGINLLRFTAGVRVKVLAILERMSTELTARLLDETVGVNTKARLSLLLADTNEIIERYYADVSGLAANKLAGLARAEAASFRHAVRSAGASLAVQLDAAMPSMNLLEAMAGDVMIQKAPSAAWWKQQGRNSVWRFSNEIRQGMAQGETNAQIVTRIVGSKRRGIPGAMDISRADAQRLVHASVQTVANTARQMTFQANRDILAGIEQVSTLDGRTTDVCLAYSGAQWDMDYEPMNGTKLPYNNPDGTPGCPRHWNCRSLMVPVTRSLRELGIDLPDFAVSQRASEHGPVAASTTMKEWLATRTDAQLAAQLGKGRAELYKKGTITLQQLLDQSGNPLSLKELEALYD
jgi:hypothetical protein